MSTLRPLLSGLALLILPLLAVPATAATLTWPGAAPCAGTLQACIDAAADGDRIEIATETPITSDIMLTDRSLTLTAADGYNPVVQSATVVVCSTTGYTSDFLTRLSHLRIDQGYVNALHNGSGAATFDFRELEVNASAGHSAIRIMAVGGTAAATLYHNRITGGSTQSAWTGLHAAAHHILTRHGQRRRSGLRPDAYTTAVGRGYVPDGLSDGVPHHQHPAPPNAYVPDGLPDGVPHHQHPAPPNARVGHVGPTYGGNPHRGRAESASPNVAVGRGYAPDDAASSSVMSPIDTHLGHAGVSG